MIAVSGEALDTLARIERMLHARIGLDPSTVGSSLVHRAVHRRMEARGIAEVPTYAALLARDAIEVQELVEEVVIPETYFFREREALDAIAARVAHAVVRGEQASPLRVLSAPCSTGEEPYSIAMSLLNAGVPANAIAIDAVDVSTNAVRRARTAIYRGGSFRGETEPFMRYFQETPHGFALRGEVRDLVRLELGNLLDPGFRAPRPAYDVIFCRNLLIYFDADAQARVLATLTLLLAPDGVLVVGAADTFAVRRAGFSPVQGAERAFLFQHRPDVEWGQPDVPRGPRIARRQGVRPTTLQVVKPAPSERKRPVAPPATPAASPAPARTPANPAAALVAEIARLADDSRLVEAIRLGERAMASPDADVELLALMGTTFAAVRNVERAEACYRRALYLDPSHADALLHLALLLDSRGESVAAARMRARVRRSIDRSERGA